MADQQAAAPPAEGAPPVEEKKKRGKPKDEYAPVKPKNAYSKFAGECRARLKEERPELVTDLKAMGIAIAEEWGKVSDEDKAKDQVRYEKEMVVWRPLWAEYKTTKHYKEFVEVKTDWLDKRAQKKLVKTMNKDAPKRPRSGYMIFGGTVREAVMEKVKAEGLGLAAAGTMISEKWQALTEGQKAEYGEQSQQQKVKFDKEFAIYRKTEAFGTFQDSKAKLESTQQQKKLIRTHLDEAPKKAASSYALFRNEVMPGITKSNEGKEGADKMSMGDMGKKCAQMWMDCPAEKKAELAVKAAALKEEYDKAFKQFKANVKYTEYLEKRQKVKARENLLVHLRELPKRPKSVFAMFAAEHKAEVTPGKGEGKGTHALKAKFAEAPKEEKDKLQEENDKLTEKWKEDVKEFKAGPRYKTFEETKQKIVLEFKNEIIKVTTLKFLDAAPPSPPKTAFAIFIGEKRKATGEPEGMKKSKEAKREEVVQGKNEWMKLDKASRDAYEGKRLDVLKAYEEKVREFMAGETWQEYQKEAKRLRIPIKSLLYHKKQIIKKTKDGKVSPASVQLPEKPDTWPSKPLNAIQIFTAEKKKTVESIGEIHKMWMSMSPEEKAPFDEQAAAQARKYGADMQEFKKSDEGRKFVRDLAVAQRRRRMIAAKNNFLDDLPKKPTSALFEWMKQNLKKVRKENPEAKGFELKKKLTDAWNALSQEEKAPLDEAASERMKQFTTAMQDFKASDNWKKYVSATKVRSFGGGGGGPKAPESMPKKPLNALQAFSKEQPSGAKASELAKQFASLPEDEKQRYMKEAAERTQQFRADLVAFESSPAGKKFRMQAASHVKRKRLDGLKRRFLKDEPTRPKGAQSLFFAANRAKVAEENPELKGLGPVQGKLAQMWKALSDDDRKEWTDKSKVENDEYLGKMNEFQATEDYKKYKRLSASLLGGGGKAKGKAKGKSMPGGVPMPRKPDNLPTANKNAFMLFGDETRANGGPGGLREVNKLWVELKAEGQKKYRDMEAELRATYVKEMREFEQSVEGKKYLRLKTIAEKKGRLAIAKRKYLGGAEQPKEPKRPLSSYFIFLGEKGKEITGKSMGEKSKELTAQWSGLKPEEKAVWEDKAKALKAKYEEDMKEYRSSSGFKAYEKTMKALTGPKAKTVARAKAGKMAKARMAAVNAARAGRGRGAGGRGRGGAKPVAKKGGKDSGSDHMGSDSKSSSSKSSSKSSSSNSD